MPPPVPPRVKLGLIMQGSPIWATTWSRLSLKTSAMALLRSLSQLSRALAARPLGRGAMSARRMGAMRSMPYTTGDTLLKHEIGIRFYLDDTLSDTAFEVDYPLQWQIKLK